MKAIQSLIRSVLAELKRPPRPAWIIVAVRSAERHGEVTLRFAPR